jgi:hypothetical protein
MLTTSFIKRTAITVTLAAVAAGFAGVRVYSQIEEARFIETGAFTVGNGEHVQFHVSLIGRGESDSADVVLRLFDADGDVLAEKRATLKDGASATLRYRNARRQRILVRGEAEILDPLLLVGRQRGATASIEVIDELSGNIRPVCAPSENLPAGRD